MTARPHLLAVEAVEALVAKSLVERLGGYEPARFGLLETLKAYAEDRLRQAGEDAEVRGAHLEHFRRLAAAYGRTVFGEMRLARRLRPERGNLSAAVEWGPKRGVGSRLASYWWAAIRPTCSTVSSLRSRRSSSALWAV